LPLIHSVWPALWPPWKRTTPWTDSASQSTILPLPSSPHWVPITTTFLLIVRIDIEFLGKSGNLPAALSGKRGSQFLQRPKRPGAVWQHQFAIANEFILALLVARQRLHDDFAGAAQLAHRGDQGSVLAPGRAYRAGAASRRQAARQFAQVEAEAG